MIPAGDGEPVARASLQVVNSPMRTFCRTCPVTILVSAMALLAWASPAITSWLQLDFMAVTDGQWWRIWTGHLTHYDGNHLFWDLLMFAILGASCERIVGSRFPAMLAIITAGISASIAWWCPEITVYRGLSGIDTALFVWFVADQSVRAWNREERIVAALWIAPSAGLVGKLLFEASTGNTLFVDSSSFTPLVQSHLAGAAFGLLASVSSRWARLAFKSSARTVSVAR